MELFVPSAVHAPALLSEPEAAELASLEATIERGLQTFVDVGTALASIRDSRLYRADYGTFEDYCRERWGMARQRAYQLIEAATSVANVSTVVDRLPENEAQARPLTSLPPEVQRDVWARAVETAPDGRVTAAHVQRTVDEMQGRETVGPEPVSDGSPAPRLHVETTYRPEPAEAEPVPDKMGVHYSSDSPEWYTPAHVLACAVEALGGIDLDPCSNAHGAPNVPAARHYTADDDGLAQDWHGRVYMNPPYGREIAGWVDKLVSEYEAGRVTEAVALVPARTDTEWFARLAPFARCFVRGRLTFTGPGSDGNAAPFPSAAVFLTDDPARFARAFAGLGSTYAKMEA